MNKKIKILTDSWWEIIIYALKNYLNDFEIKRFNIDLLWKKSFDWWDCKNAIKLRKYENKKDFEIIHYNNWCDPIISKIPKNKITIFESHSIHIWLDLKNALNISENIFKKNIIFFIHFFYKTIFYFRIKKYDLYFVSILCILKYAKKIRKDVIWIPNIIDFSLFEKEYKTLNLDKKYYNIFLPTTIRKIKNQGKNWKIIENIFKKYKNIKIYVIKHPSSNYKLIEKSLEKFKENIIWLPLIERNNLWKYYKSDWNLVLWSMWPYDDYAMLNMIELEAMACRCPIVAMDSFEIIKTKYEDIEKLAFKVLEDKQFRKDYIEKNYNYVKKIHSAENVSKIYLENLKPLLKEKFNINL